ncbi:MAG: acyl-CoA synthetase [Betaproteobacteria bacterium]
MSRHWLDQRERGSVFGIRLIVGLSFFLGRRFARLLLYPTCLYFLMFSVASRRASRKYLARALGRPPRFADLFRHYFAFATVALDRFFLLKDRYALFQIQIHGEEILQQLLDRGQGCLLLGAHLGSFEVLRAAGSAHRLEVSMIMYEDNAKMVNAVVKAVNPQAPARIIALGRLDSMFQVHERLQRNAWVGILGDRVLPGGEQQQATFLGEPAWFPTSPYRISLMLRRPIVFMTGLYRGGNRYELHFEKLFDPEGVSRTQRAAAIEQALGDYVQRLEYYCRQAPYNWFNFYDFWAKGPDPAVAPEQAAAPGEATAEGSSADSIERRHFERPLSDEPLSDR